MFPEAAKTRFSIARLVQTHRAKWLLIVLYIGLAYPSPGQTSTYSYTRADTIRAIQRLFDQKRMGGQITTAVGVPITILGAGTGILVSTLSALFSLGKTKNSILPTALLYSSFGLAPTGIGIGRLLRYSRQREELLIDTYESGVPLPAFVRRELRPRHFEFIAGAASSPPISGR
jgi:hypothetical protein